MLSVRDCSVVASASGDGVSYSFVTVCESGIASLNDVRMESLAFGCAVVGVGEIEREDDGSVAECILASSVWVNVTSTSDEFVSVGRYGQVNVTMMAIQHNTHTIAASSIVCGDDAQCIVVVKSNISKHRRTAGEGGAMKLSYASGLTNKRVVVGGCEFVGCGVDGMMGCAGGVSTSIGE